MTILSRSPENGDGLGRLRGAATDERWELLRSRALEGMAGARERAATALQVLEDEWQENVVETTPRWLVAVMVTWSAVAVLVLLAITTYAILAF